MQRQALPSRHGGAIGGAPPAAAGARRPPRRRLALRAAAAAAPAGTPPIMVNSCTGKMGHAAAEAVVRAGLTLVPFSFTGRSEAVAVGNVGVAGVPVELVEPAERQAALDRIVAAYPGLVVVDYTLPSAVNANAEFYAANGLPFVMGTTGGDRDAMVAVAKESGVYAVIAPNMGKQIVALQTALQLMAERFPGCMSGYSLRVVESHQRSKVDASGTAKAVAASLAAMAGRSFDPDADIELVRDPAAQVARMRVPEAALGGHAFHTYTLTSPDGSVQIEFKHNVVGREVYAEGTVDAAVFLASRVAERAEQRIYSMVDVLTAGAMR